MEAGISYIKSVYADRESTMLLAPPSFWYGCQFYIDNGYPFSTVFALKRRFDQCRETLELICFPLCHESHWFMIVLSFTEREIRFAEGLNRSPPYDLVDKIKATFHMYFHVNISDWKDSVTRVPSPPQNDGDSCGILTLSHIESLYSGRPIEYNSQPSSVASLRLRWIDRCVRTHIQTQGFVHREIARSSVSAEYGLKVTPQV